LYYDILWRLAEDRRTPQWNVGSEFKAARESSTAPRK
jgi:hypothetical protein